MRKPRREKWETSSKCFSCVVQIVLIVIFFMLIMLISITRSLEFFSVKSNIFSHLFTIDKDACSIVLFNHKSKITYTNFIEGKRNHFRIFVGFQHVRSRAQKTWLLLKSKVLPLFFIELLIRSRRNNWLNNLWLSRRNFSYILKRKLTLLCEDFGRL